MCQMIGRENKLGKAELIQKTDSMYTTNSLTAC